MRQPRYFLIQNDLHGKMYDAAAASTNIVRCLAGQCHEVRTEGTEAVRWQNSRRKDTSTEQHGSRMRSTRRTIRLFLYFSPPAQRPRRDARELPAHTPPRGAASREDCAGEPPYAAAVAR